MSREVSRRATVLLRAAALLVPSEARAEWRAEWEGELWVLAESRPRGQLRFCAGAVRHALWLRARAFWPAGFGHELGQAVRTLVGAPGFVAASVVTLALGIGANATVFALVNGLALRAPAGIASPDELVQIGRGERVADFDAWSAPWISDVRESTRAVFTGVAAWSATRGILGRGSDARPVAVQVVSGEYFDVLGVRAAAGRLLLPEEASRPGESPVVVLSHSLWQSAFAGDPAVVGSDVYLNGRRWRVVGVAAAGFAGTDPLRSPPDFWAPLNMQGALTGRPDAVLGDRGNSWLWVFARRATGVDVARARSRVEAAHARIIEAYPDFTRAGVLVVEGIGARPDDRTAVLRLGALLMATVLLVLVIACANLTGLALARGATREGEMAVRVALGASRDRLVRQLLAESAIVAVLGGFLALLLARSLSSLLPRLLPVPVAVSFAPDLRVIGVCALAALASVLFFGVLPAYRIADVDPLGALRRGAISRGRAGSAGRLRPALVVFQISLAFVLLTAATQLVRSLREASLADPGFRTRGVLVATLDVGRSLDLDASARHALRRRLIDGIAALPGVEAVGTTTILPVVDPQPNRAPLREGDPLPAIRPDPVYLNSVDGGFFPALGLRTVAGRLFDTSVDANAATPPVLVNETFAERFFPDGRAVGATVPWAFDGAPAIIVGVVVDATIRALGEVPPAVIYEPAFRAEPGSYHLLVATNSGAVSERVIASAIEQLAPRLPILRLASLDDLVADSFATTRLTAFLAAAAGALALLLAVTGLYGVIACAVADRKREFGLRFALGAVTADVLRLVAWNAARLAAIGIALGLLLSLAGLRLLSGLLFGVRPIETPTLAAIATLLLAIALATCAVPALRAAQVDPARALGS